MQSVGTVEPEVRTQRGRKADSQDSLTCAPRLLGFNDAGAYLGCSYWTVRSLVERGELPAVRIPGVRRTLIDRTDIDRLITTWKEPAK